MLNNSVVVRHTITFKCSELGVPSAWYRASVATCNNSTTRGFVPGAVKANNNSLGNHCCWFVARYHKLLKQSPHYVLFESTLRFDDRGCTRSSPASPGVSEVTYVVKKMEQETTWE